MYGLPVRKFSLRFISDLGALTHDAVVVNLVTRTKGQIFNESKVLRMLEPADPKIHFQNPTLLQE
jgi:hypothetical protein